MHTLSSCAHRLARTDKIQLRKMFPEQAKEEEGKDVAEERVEGGDALALDEGPIFCTALFQGGEEDTDILCEKLEFPFPPSPPPNKHHEAEWNAVGLGFWV